MDVKVDARLSAVELLDEKAEVDRPVVRVADTHAMTSDAVVVGAGHNGLVAANVPADAGWDVTVLEASQRPGGGVRSAEITAPGFHSDLCSALYPFAAASPVFA
ncbi:hypothetical protein Pen01_50470 [Phytomonospora endophytica]|nr:hypothetical protein Pen01_50470 [Phytomonospora endophytica]